MPTIRRALFPLAGLAAVLACADSPTEPTAEIISLNPISSSVTAVCETVTFDEFAHGDYVTSVSLPTLGLTLTVESSPNVLPGGGANPNTTPRAFDTNSDPLGADPDLTSGGLCTGCAGLGRLLVLDDERNTGADFSDGDYRYGGVLRLSGFTGGDYYVESFTYVDNNTQQPGDVGDEPAVVMRVDGTTDIGSTTPGPEANVQTVTTTQTPFSSMIEVRSGTVIADQLTGSGGLDDIVICQIPPPPPPGDAGTRTPGYWKNHPEAWPVETITIGGEVIQKDDAIAYMLDGNGSNKVWNMFSHLVAAKLNGLMGATTTCVDATIAAADQWMDDHAGNFYPAVSYVSMNGGAAPWKNGGEALKNTLDSYNNGNLCAPKDD